MKLLTRKEEYVEKERFSNSLSVEIERKRKLLNELNDKLLYREEDLVNKERDFELKVEKVEELSEDLHVRMYELDKREMEIKRREQNLGFAEKLFHDQVDEFSKVVKQ